MKFESTSGSLQDPQDSSSFFFCVLLLIPSEFCQLNNKDTKYCNPFLSSITNSPGCQSACEQCSFIHPGKQADLYMPSGHRDFPPSLSHCHGHSTSPAPFRQTPCKFISLYSVSFLYTKPHISYQSPLNAAFCHVYTILVVLSHQVNFRTS